MSDSEIRPAHERLLELTRELESAIAANAKATQALAEARNFETATLNRINNTQKAIDAVLQEMKKGAPSDSEWSRQMRKGHPA